MKKSLIKHILLGLISIALSFEIFAYILELLVQNSHAGHSINSSLKAWLAFLVLSILFRVQIMSILSLGNKKYSMLRQIAKPINSSRTIARLDEIFLKIFVFVIAIIVPFLSLIMLVSIFADMEQFISVSKSFKWNELVIFIGIGVVSYFLTKKHLMSRCFSLLYYKYVSKPDNENL